MHLVEWKLNKQSKMIQSKGCHFHWLICVCDGTRGRKFLYRVAATLSPRDLARVNSDKRHGPKCSDSVENEIATTDNLLWPNCDSDGKADNKQQAFINTTTRHFKIQTGDMGPTPLPPPQPPICICHIPVTRKSSSCSVKVAPLDFLGCKFYLFAKCAVYMKLENNASE